MLARTELLKREVNMDESYLQFLIEQSDREIKNLWTRTDLLSVINTAGIGAVIVGTLDNPNELKPIIIGASTIGILVCMAWLHIHKMSRYYAHRWLTDAREILKNNDQNRFQFLIQCRNRPCGPSATATFYYVIGLFGLPWIGIFIWALVGLTG
jgi:hypothetical protein